MPALVEIDRLRKEFRGETAIDNLTASLAKGRITGLVGPDGAGKTTLIRLINGLLAPTRGTVRVNGFDAARERAKLAGFIGYMPQKFGLYEDLTVLENLRLYARLHDVPEDERQRQFEKMLEFTDLARFTGRLAGALSGGMKQKLGLACSLLGRPRLLLLDEPGVGVDPISRRELWSMVNALLDGEMTVLWSTSYLDEAERCESVLLLNESKLLFSGPPAELTGRLQDRVRLLRGIEGDRRKLLARLLDKPGVIDGVIQGSALRLVFAADAPCPSLASLGVERDARELIPVQPRFEDAFIDILGGGPGGHSELAERFKPLPDDGATVAAAHTLVKRYGSFTAADRIDFRIRRGEIFGLLGPNGAGKSTTFKMLCGLLRPTSGSAEINGADLQRSGPEARRQLGYMAQKFSQYDGLNLLQNLRFFAGIYGLTGRDRDREIDGMVDAFHFAPYLKANAGDLPLGIRQRLALACAVMHKPAVLFLDEPTSGVSPVTRREFWTHINALVDKGVTVLITTHFMDEAEYCDRIALVYRGRAIATGTPDELKEQVRSADCPDPSMEDAFIRLVQESDRQEASR